MLTGVLTRTIKSSEENDRVLHNLISNAKSVQRSSTDDDSSNVPHTRHFDKLTIKNLFVDGLVAGINITDLKNGYLKTTGNQEITGGKTVLPDKKSS